MIRYGDNNEYVLAYEANAVLDGWKLALGQEKADRKAEVSRLKDDYAALEARCAGLERERDELQLAFDRSHDANMRGINAWQKVTGKDLVWPDQGNLVEWLLAERDAAVAAKGRAETCLLELLDRIGEGIGHKFESWEVAAFLRELRAEICAALADTTTGEVQP